jgi:ABC-type uncharacterized transport system permease subunit
MDKQLAIQWLVTAAVRLIAGYFVVKLGGNAVAYGTTIDGFASGVGSAVLAGISLYTSVKGRQVLLNTPVPQTRDEK